jgi:hypothetical protein
MGNSKIINSIQVCYSYIVINFLQCKYILMLNKTTNVLVYN